MNVAVYLRKSRTEEISNSKKETLQRHKTLLLNFAKENKLKIIQIYEEVVSGEHLYSRPKMLELLNDINLNIYDAVLCMDIDRLGRGAMSDQGIILETLKKNNTKIITPRKIYDLNNELDEEYTEFETFIARRELKLIKRRMQRGIKKTIDDGGYIPNAPDLNNELDEEYTEFETFIARRELKLIKRRMQRGIKKTIDDGGYIPNAPYGYDKIKINKLPSLKINTNEAVFVKMIFDLYNNHGKGCQAIAEILNNMGAKSKRLNKFNRSSILHILKNPVYIGEIVWNQSNSIKQSYNTELNKGLHEPIIDIKTFKKTQNILQSRYHPPYNNGNINNPFSGIIRCSNCNKLMQRRPYKNINKEYLICTTKNCCKAVEIDKIENAIIDVLKSHFNNIKIDINPINNQNIIKNAIKNLNNKIKNIETQKNNIKELLEQKILNPINNQNIIKNAIKNLNNKIKNIETQKNNIKELLEQKIYDKKTFLERNLILKNNLKLYMQSRDKLEKDLIKNKNKSYKNYSVLDAYKNANPAQKNMLLKLILKEIKYAREKGLNKFKLTIKLIKQNNV